MPESRNLPWESKFGKRMKQERERDEISQTELAKRVTAKGIAFHQQTVQRIEAGLRPVRLNEAMVVAELLNNSLDEMVQSGTPKAARQEMGFHALRLVNILNRLEDLISREYDSLADAIEEMKTAINSYVRVCNKQNVKYVNRDFHYAQRNLRLAQDASEVLQVARERWNQVNNDFVYSHDEFMEEQWKLPQGDDDNA